MAVDTKEIELCIKGLLISRPTVAKANVLHREVEEELGKPFPLRQLGVQTFVDYLRTIPNVVQLQPQNGYNPDVYPVASRASSHIDQLVSKQRVPPSRKRGVGRHSAYGSRAPIAPVRRRPARVVSRPITSVVRSNQPSYAFQSREFRSRSLISSSSKNGIDVRDLERHVRSNYDERDLTRNGIHNMDNLLTQAKGMVECNGTKVYPKLSSASKNTEPSYEGNGIPAGYEDELDDFDDEYDFYDEDMEKDSEEEMSKQAIQLWSKALGVQEKDSSVRSLEREEETCAGKSREATLDNSYRDQVCEEPEENCNFSKTMINNFRKILNEYPDGIWASQLPQLYYDHFHVPLGVLNLGYSSVIGLVSDLPSVFSFKKVGSHDWKLYDARYITQESLESQENKDNLSTENGIFIPQTIIENIKTLLVNNTIGITSIDLLKKYQETYRKTLDLESLGFDTLEEFLHMLKGHITLKKGSNFYILFPKHVIVSYEAMEPPKPDERLNIPAVALCVPIPENVMRLGEEIPMQELPPVQEDPSKPLLELEIRVAEVISPVFFYIILSNTYEELDTMMDDLHKFYEWEQENLQIPLPHFAVGLYCAAKYSNYWHRARITRVKGDGNVEIEYIDYGTPEVVKYSELRYLTKEFTEMPSQAMCAKLIGVKPLGTTPKFPQDVCYKFLDLVSGKRLVAHVYEVGARERMQLELILFDVNEKEEIVINDYLIENGLASPFSQIPDVSTEIQQVVENLKENEFISLQANGSTTSLSLSGSPLLPENGATSLPANPITFPASLIDKLSQCLLSQAPSNSFYISSPRIPSVPQNPSKIDKLSQCLLSQAPSNSFYIASPRIPSVPQNPSKSTPEEVKTRRPPPGFEDIHPEPNFEFSIPHQSTSQNHSTNSQSRQSPYKSAEKEPKEPNVFINYFLVNNTEKYPELTMQEQYLPQRVYQPNPSNMPLVGSPLVQLPKQNIPPQRSLAYGSFVSPPNPYSPHPNIYRQQGYTVPNNYFPVNPPVPVNLSAPSNFMLIPPVVPRNYVMMNTHVPTPYYGVYPPGFVDVSQNMQAYINDVSLHPQTAHSRSPPVPTKLTHPPPTVPVPASVPTKPSPTPSPAPAFTPITVPEWPPKNLPVYTNSATETEIASCSDQSVSAPFIKSQSPKNIQISRPCTPLTPGSAEVANICKHSRPASSASNNSKSKSQNLESISSNSQISISPVENVTSASQVTKGPIENATSNSQINVSPTENSTCHPNNSTSILQNKESEIDSSRNNSEPFLDDKIDDLTDEEELDDTLLPSEEIPLPPSTPEKSHSAISSSVGSLFYNTPTKGLSSDDYASACENIEEVKERFSHVIVTNPSQSFYQSSEDIPDSWENLDLDDTPARADNFEMDFSQPLDLLDNSKSESTVKSNVSDDEKCAFSREKSQFPPTATIQAPVNWKDVFNPDAISCSERVNNNNEVRGKTPSPVKLGVKKIPVQKMEIQGKFFHLICVNNVPAVIPLEFLKQFIPMNPTVMEKVLEVSHNKFYNISKAEHPDIFAELNKVDEFCGGTKKKAVIRLNKVRLINISEMPKCLNVLHISNQPLLDDLKKISDELESL